MIFDYKYEFGGWVDNVSSDRKSAGYASASLGIEPKFSDWFYINSFWGVALITNTDTQLSTPYEFMQDLGVGVKDSRGVRIGTGYKHISNAGIKQPNRGRDFLFINLQIPW